MSLLMIVKIIILIIVSAVILWVSWSSLRNPKVHGFYRFFVFEIVLIQFLLAMEYWFNDPFSPFQIVSWLLLFISLVPVINALRLLRVVGKPEGNFEQTTVLVVSGLYKFIRHPMYASLLYLSWGIFFKLPELVPFCLVLGATAFIVATAKAEENEDIAKFGEAYTEYMKKTKRFIPFVF